MKRAYLLGISEGYRSNIDQVINLWNEQIKAGKLLYRIGGLNVSNADMYVNCTKVINMTNFIENGRRYLKVITLNVAKNA